AVWRKPTTERQPHQRVVIPAPDNSPWRRRGGCARTRGIAGRSARIVIVVGPVAHPLLQISGHANDAVGGPIFGMSVDEINLGFVVGAAFGEVQPGVRVATSFRPNLVAPRKLVRVRAPPRLLPLSFGW